MIMNIHRPGRLPAIARSQALQSGAPQVLSSFLNHNEACAVDLELLKSASTNEISHSSLELKLIINQQGWRL